MPILRRNNQASGSIVQCKIVCFYAIVAMKNTGTAQTNERLNCLLVPVPATRRTFRRVIDVINSFDFERQNFFDHGEPAPCIAVRCQVDCVRHFFSLVFLKLLRRRDASASMFRLVFLNYFCFRNRKNRRMRNGMSRVQARCRSIITPAMIDIESFINAFQWARHT